MNSTSAVDVKTQAVSAALSVGVSCAIAICGDSINANPTNTKSVRAATGELKQVIEISRGKSLKVCCGGILLHKLIAMGGVTLSSGFGFRFHCDCAISRGCVFAMAGELRRATLELEREDRSVGSRSSPCVVNRFRLDIRTEEIT